MTLIKTASEPPFTATPVSLTTLPADFDASLTRHQWTFFGNRVAVHSDGFKGIYVQEQGQSAASPLAKTRRLGEHDTIWSIGTDGKNLVALLQHDEEGVYHNDIALVGVAYENISWVRFNQLPEVRRLLKRARNIADTAVFAVDELHSTSSLYASGQRLLLNVDTGYSNKPWLKDRKNHTTVQYVDGLGGNGVILKDGAVIDARSADAAKVLTRIAAEFTVYDLLKPLQANTRHEAFQLRIYPSWGRKFEPGEQLDVAVGIPIGEPSRVGGVYRQDNLVHVVYNRVTQPKHTLTIGKYAKGFGGITVVHPTEIGTYQLEQTRDWDVPPPPSIHRDKHGVQYLGPALRHAGAAYQLNARTGAISRQATQRP